MSQTNGLICGVDLDGNGGGRFLEAEEALSHEWEGLRWLHLDRTVPATAQWIHERSGLPEIVCDALLAEDTRPREATLRNGTLIVLRGVNLNPGMSPDEMISIRIWFGKRRIISLRASRLASASEIADTLRHGAGPRNKGDFLVEIAERLNDKMEPILDNLEAVVDDILDQKDDPPETRRETLLSVRRQIVSMRRHIAPQRDLLGRLRLKETDWLDAAQSERLHEAADQLVRIMEDLDVANENARLAQDDLESRLSNQLNRRMYLLAILSGVFLPLGFLTGLLGVNLAGIPGAEAPHAFFILCLLLTGVAGMILLLFRKMRLL